LLMSSFTGPRREKTRFDTEPTNVPVDIITKPDLTLSPSTSQAT
jgi:hypothetical protein